MKTYTIYLSAIVSVFILRRVFKRAPAPESMIIDVTPVIQRPPMSQADSNWVFGSIVGVLLIGIIAAIASMV